MKKEKEIVQKIDKIHLLRHLYLRKALSESSIHFRQFPLMKFVSDHEGCTQADLAEHFSVSAASVATSTKRLQKAGLLEKRPDSENLRCNRLYVTSGGKEALLEHESVFGKLDEGMFEGFSEDEIHTLSHFLGRIGKNIASLSGAGEMDCHQILTLMKKFDEKEDE